MSKNGNLRLVASALNVATKSSFVRIFKYLTDIDSWNQIGEDITGNFNDRFGYEVAISGDGGHVAIGAPYAANIFGKVHYYSVTDSGWTLGTVITGGSQEFLFDVIFER